MIAAVAFAGLLSLTQLPAPCADVASCQTMAAAAREAKDYEAFHDLAWAAYRKGKSNDPELMLLVARAQSLSGRPGDALVMIERLVPLGNAADVLTSEDFARVRALSRWTEVAEKLTGGPAKEPASAFAKATADRPPAKNPASAFAKATADRPSAKEPAPPAKAPRDPNAPLAFTTLLTPDALTYDAVSRRFIIADKKARRVAVIDEHTGQVATLVGAQGALGAISGIAIDPQQGDLWVISTGEAGPALHRMQLISGRMLTTVPLAVEDSIVAMAWVPGSGLVAADSTGVVWGVRADGKSQKLAALEYVPRGFAADARGRLYVAAGASRLARFAVNAALRKIDTIELERGIPTDAPFAVSGNRIHFIVPVQDAFEVRNIPLR